MHFCQLLIIRVCCKGHQWVMSSFKISKLIFFTKSVNCQINSYINFNYLKCNNLTQVMYFNFQPKDTGFSRLMQAIWHCAKHVTYTTLHPKKSEAADGWEHEKRKLNSLSLSVKRRKILRHVEFNAWNCIRNE